MSGDDYGLAELVLDVLVAAHVVKRVYALAVRQVLHAELAERLLLVVARHLLFARKRNAVVLHQRDYPDGRGAVEEREGSAGLPNEGARSMLLAGYYEKHERGESLLVPGAQPQAR